MAVWFAVASSYSGLNILILERFVSASCWLLVAAHLVVNLWSELALTLYINLVSIKHYKHIKKRFIMHHSL